MKPDERARYGSFEVTRSAQDVPGGRMPPDGGRHGARRWIAFHVRLPAPRGKTMRYGVAMPLRIPAVLAFTVVGATAAGAAAVSCGGSAPAPDAMVCLVRCIPIDTGSNGCTPPTCASGPNHDVCPTGCRPEPIA